jgi:hypothetical protein
VITLLSFFTGGVVLFSALAGTAWLRSATARILAPLQDGKPIDYRMVIYDDGSYQIIAKGFDVG